MAKGRRRDQRAALKRKERERRVGGEKAKRRGLQEGGGLRAALEKCRELPIEECVISKGWRESGLAHVLMVRQAGGEKLIVGGYYVDILCVGLKDTAVIRDITKADYTERVKPNVFKDHVEFESCDPGLARAVVEGAISFAERFGFQPNKRWSESKLLLRGIRSAEGEISFGRSGKPCLVVRSGENPAVVQKRLERYAGEGNYLIVYETQDSRLES